jgi:alpha-L-rhamnosidase
MFGEISAWFYKALGGIRPDPAHPGFKNILLDPHFVKGLAHFEASHRGPCGMIVSKWTRTKNKMEYSVTVPANSTAILTLPAPNVREGKEPVGKNQFVKIISSDKSSVKLSLSAGKYNFTWSDK